MRFVTIILLFVTLVSFGQNDTAFINIYGSDGIDIVSDGIVTKSKTYMLIGRKSAQSNSDIYLLEIDSNFNKISSFNIGTEFTETGNSIIQLEDSSFIIAGQHNSWGFGSYDGYVAKFSKSKGLIWEKSVGSNGWDEIKQVKVINDRAFLLVNSNPLDSLSTSFIEIISPENGKTQKKIFINDTIQIESLIGFYPFKNDFVLCGNVSKNQNFENQIVIIKIDSSGNVLNKNFYGEEGVENANVLYKDLENNFLIGGYSDSKNLSLEGKEDFYLIKVDSNLNHLNEKTYGSPTTDILEGIIQTKSKDYIISGSASDGSFGLGGWGHRIIQTSSSLSFKNGPTFGDKNDEKASIILNNIQGTGFAFFGFTTSYNSKYEDVYSIHIPKENIINNYFLKINQSIDYTQTITSISSQNEYENLQFLFSNNTLEIYQSNIMNFKLKVYSADGKLVYVDFFNDQSKKINLNQLNKGFYILLVTSDIGKTISHKFIVN